MNQTHVTRIGIFLLLGVLLAQGVFAQDFFDSFERILGGDNLVEFYENNTVWVDAILYFVMFISISRYAFHKQIRDNKSFKSVALVMGFALAIGASTAASNFGFSLVIFNSFSQTNH